MDVSRRFENLLENIKLTSSQVADGTTKHRGVRACLNLAYYGKSDEVANSGLVGSWAKATPVRPPRDIDVLFELPSSVFARFQQRSGNIQSQILQEVKNHLSTRYSNTDIKGDGPVVVVRFNSYNIELVPCFKLGNGQYLILVTNNGGSYKTFDPIAEIELIKQTNRSTQGNLVNLIRMMKCWQSECSVPIKSFFIELLAVEFIKQWRYAAESMFFYDWMVRDFLEYMIKKAGTSVIVPGTYEILLVGDSWLSRAKSAHGRAVLACDYESQKYVYSAGDTWQKIFGSSMPMG